MLKCPVGFQEDIMESGDIWFDQHGLTWKSRTSVDPLEQTSPSPALEARWQKRKAALKRRLKQALTVDPFTEPQKGCQSNRMVKRVSSDPLSHSSSPNHDTQRQRTKAAFSALKRRLSLPSPSSSLRRLLYFFKPKVDWGKSRAQDPSQYRHQSPSVEDYLFATDPSWSAACNDAAPTEQRTGNLPVPQNQPLTQAWLKSFVTPCGGHVVCELQPPAEDERSAATVDEALPDEDIFRRLEALHAEQSRLEHELLRRGLGNIRIAGRGSSRGASHYSAQWDELNEIVRNLPPEYADICVEEKTWSGVLKEK